jgi:hypothetical protein
MTRWTTPKAVNPPNDAAAIDEKAPPKKEVQEYT